VSERLSRPPGQLCSAALFLIPRGDLATLTAFASALELVALSCLEHTCNPVLLSVEHSRNAVLLFEDHSCNLVFLSGEHTCNPVLLSQEHSRNAVLLSEDHSCNPYPYSYPMQRPTSRIQTATLSTESPQLSLVAFLLSLPKSHGVG